MTSKISMALAIFCIILHATTISARGGRFAREVEPASTESELGEPQVESLHAETTVHSRFANTLVTSRVKNVMDETTEVKFHMNLPENAFITNFTMLIDGELIIGDVKEKEEAKRDYDRAVAAGQSAGLVAQSPRASNTFSTSVSVAALSKVTFHLTYQDILQREHGLYRHQFNIDLPQPIADLQIAVEIVEQEKISTYKVPTVGGKIAKKTNKVLKTIGMEKSVKVDESKIDGETSVLKIVYAPTAKEQKALSLKTGAISAQLAVLYDVERAQNGGQIQVVDGYFVHFFAPNDLPITAKRIVFVIDTSGSMSGTKMSQTKTAMKSMLEQLNELDEFVILEFDDDVNVWKEEFTKVDGDSVAEADKYVQGLSADGGTNINDALKKSLELVKEKNGLNDKLSLIIFLTDGQATSGMTNSKTMLENVGNWTAETPTAVHTLSFGQGADYTLMKGISMATDGLARKIYEDSDADLQMEGFYAAIANPLLTNLDIEYLNSTVDADSIVADNALNYYEGGEMVIVGKLADTHVSLPADVPFAQIDALGRGDEDSAFVRRHWTCVLPPHIFPRPHPIEVVTDAPIAEIDTLGGYVQRMWAYRTIKKMLNERKYGQLSTEEKDGLKEKALAMSLEYNFVTELTSMVVVKPNSTDTNGTAIEETTDMMRPSPMSHMMSRSGMNARYAMAMPARTFNRVSHQMVPRGPPGQMDLSHHVAGTGGPPGFTPPPTTTTTDAPTTTEDLGLCVNDWVMAECKDYCGAGLNTTCEEYMNIAVADRLNPSCPTVCPPKGQNSTSCYCPKGTLTANTDVGLAQCVPKERCDPTCLASNHESLVFCSAAGIARCPTVPDSSSFTPCSSTATPSCQCDEGYVRLEDENKCVEVEDCPKIDADDSLFFF